MRQHRTRPSTRVALALAVVAGLLWAVPVHAGPAAPVPTVTITTEPTLGQKLPPTLTAAWTIDRPGVMATLRVKGKVLARTTVVAVWTSPPHLIKRGGGLGGMHNSWDNAQAPVGEQSRQAVGLRVTTLRRGWGPWSDETPSSRYQPYVDLEPRTSPGIIIDFVHDGPTLPRGQVQYRLVLTLEPGTDVSHNWNVNA